LPGYVVKLAVFFTSAVFFKRIVGWPHSSAWAVVGIASTKAKRIPIASVAIIAAHAEERLLKGSPNLETQALIGAVGLTR
jgi:hypothetical protein